MPTERGRLAAIAFRFVKQCHSDLGKLFRDLDDLMTATGSVRLWNGRDAVTQEVSKSIDAKHWMPSKAYRIYRHPDYSNHVEGINALFFCEDSTVVEPLLVTGRARYNVPNGKNISSKGVVLPWDFIDSFLRLNRGAEINPNQVLHFTDSDAERLSEIHVVGADLYYLLKPAPLWPCTVLQASSNPACLSHSRQGLGKLSHDSG